MIETTLANGLIAKINPEDEQLPQRKIAQERYDLDVTHLADQRETHCWLCDRTPNVWIREVLFDLGQGDSPPSYKTGFTVNSSHYPGPVPGFCLGHLATGPSHLAELVYNSQEIVAWGFRPTRWFVIFTDGTLARGNAVEIDPDPSRSPLTQETYVKGEGVVHGYQD